MPSTISKAALLIMAQKSRRKSILPIPRALKVQGLGPMEIAVLVKDAGLAWNTDGAASMGAALAFYTIFSIAPVLIRCRP